MTYKGGMNTSEKIWTTLSFFQRKNKHVFKLELGKCYH